MLTIFLSGLLIGASLIIAIGPQNAFILRQGIKRRHVFISVIIPCISDSLLIIAGVLGFGIVVEKFPSLITAVTWAGAAFLIVYGLKSFQSALRPKTLDHESAKGMLEDGGVKKIAMIIIALTWLNPHVYLDTVILLGSIAASYGDPGRYIFGSGAVIASFIWFFGLGYGARFLAPLFEKPKAWQVLDILIGIIMIGIAFKLIL